MPTCIRIAVAFLVLFPPLLTAGEIKGDAEAGKAKSAVCAACHGADGNSVNPEWPKIAGQGQRYFIEQLKAFKQAASDPENSSRRTPNAALMYGIAAGLTEQDMADLAAYYGSQKISLGTADDALARRGEAIYRGGNMDLGSPACIGCHGPSGKGNPSAGFPAVAGQHANYVYNQLQAFHNGQRTGDANDMMRNMVRKMSTEEMRQVAEYIQGLH